MPQTYFTQLRTQTPTRVWVNNPTVAEMDLALAEGVSFIETKPEVCWQLPVRRSYEHRNVEDGTEYLVIVIGEFVHASIRHRQ